MDISFSQRVISQPYTMVNDLGGEAVMLNLKSACYYGLDKTGSRMWAVLTGSESIQAAYEALLSECDVEPERLRRDLIGLIEKLVEHELVAIERVGLS